MIAKKLLTFFNAASTLTSRVTVAQFVPFMIIHRFRGGEFYARCTAKFSTVCTKWWDSSVKQLWSIVEDSSMLIGVAARIVIRPGIFFCLPPHFPHHAQRFLNLNIDELCL